MEQIKYLLLRLAEYYCFPITENQLSMFAEDLADVPPDELRQVIIKYRQTPGNVRFPLPAALKQALGSCVTDRDEATVEAGRIRSAISVYGSYQIKLAKEALGESTWVIVKLMGGWETVCGTTQDDRGMFFAQVRDLVEASQRMSKVGKLNTKFELKKLELEKLEVQKPEVAQAIRHMVNETLQ